MISILAVAAIALLIAYYITRRVTSQSLDLPRVGQPGLIGYLSAALRFTLHAENLIVEGREKFCGQPFVLPTLAGSVILLSPEHLPVLRSSSDNVVSIMCTVLFEHLTL